MKKITIFITVWLIAILGASCMNSDSGIKKDIVAATIIVAASDSLHKERADYICDGTDDHVEIQAALDALPATGGEVLLLDGTYYIEVSLALDSYQTLRGCGRNTILTTTTADIDIITATGGAGTEKVGILIADLCVDGNAGGAVNDNGIYWRYVDDSKIRDVWGQNNGDYGILLYYCDSNEISGNTCQGSGGGICIVDSTSNTVTGNTCPTNRIGIYFSGVTDSTIVGNICKGNVYVGIMLDGDSYNNTISGNTCNDNDTGGPEDSGIFIEESHYNAITGNQCEGNGAHGIYLVDSNYCTIVGNVCNNQTTGDGINIEGSSYNSITGNVCYNNGDDGIEIVATSTKNIILGNQLQGNSGTNLVDGGIGTLVRDNQGTEIYDNKIYQMMKNTSGGELAAGDVVVFKTGVAAGNEVTTTTAKGDDYAYGMIAETIADNAVGLVQIGGKTTALKVDGTDDIAIGDFICTFTTAKIGCKAGAGDMAFAIALEAYTADDSNGVIDALIISGMKI